TDSTDETITDLSTGASPKMAVVDIDDARPLPRHTNNRLAITSHRESIPKVHNNNPKLTAKKLNPQVVSGMKTTLCNLEPTSSGAGTANTATEATRAPACRALKSAAVW